MKDITTLEPHDITRIMSNGDAVTLPDGTRALPVLLVLHPDCAAHLPPERIRLGAIEQTYVLEPQPASATALAPTPPEDA